MVIHPIVGVYILYNYYKVFLVKVGWVYAQYKESITVSETIIWSPKVGPEPIQLFPWSEITPRNGQK